MTISAEREKTLSRERLIELFHVDPDKGLLIWKARQDQPQWNAKYAGKPAGSVHKHSGYVFVTIDYEKYRAHRLIWLFVHGEFPADQIDHDNGRRADNRIDNLLPATALSNLKNKAISSSNKSGICGVSWDARRQKWFAVIYVNYRRVTLGHFEDKAEAAAARKVAERKYGYHENHGRAAA